MNCEQMMTLLSVRLDGELTPAEEAQVEEHLTSCPDCRGVWEQICALHFSLDDLEPMQAPAGFARGVMDRVRAEEGPKVIPLFRRPQVRALMSMAACAVLAVGLFRVGMPGENKSAEPAAHAPMMAMAVPESAPVEDRVPAEAPMAMAPAPQAEAAPEPEVRMNLSMAAPPAHDSVAAEGERKELAGGVMTAGTLTMERLPEGAEELLKDARWEEREEDGGSSCLITGEQAEGLLALAGEQGIVLLREETGEEGLWRLILTGEK